MRELLTGLLLSLSLPATAQEQVRPNVVLIISDDQGWGDYGFMGSAEIRTPHLDALADQSLVFPRGYVPTALCRASLATLVTGLYPHEHGITGNDPRHRTDRERLIGRMEELVTLPELLGAAGYRSLQTGKWWEGGSSSGGFSEGMTHGDPLRGGAHGDEGLKIGRETMQPAFDFIDACRAEGAPFFLWYSPLLPHWPHDPPQRLLAEYEEPGVPPSIARYRAMCAWFDEGCGRLLEHLDASGVSQDTLVVLVTDNGWIQREDAGGNAPRSKRSPYEGGVRTPIVLRWPGRIEPGRRDVPVSSVDIPATILAACGIERPEAWQGVDLRSVGAERGPVFGAAFTSQVVDVQDPGRSLLTRWVVRDPFKLLVHEAPGQSDELYDLRADPAEERPLEDQATALELRAELDRWWPGAARRPNLLVVLTDDQRFDQLGCAGHPVLRTPTLDALAAGGVRFSNAFVTTSMEAASRVSLMISRREGRHGYSFGRPPLGQELAGEAYFARLREAGYRTGFVGKWGGGFARPVEELFDEQSTYGPPYLRDGEPHLTERIADAALSFLDVKGYAAREPFCLTISFCSPYSEEFHPAPYVPPPELATLYADVAVPALPDTRQAFEALPPLLRTSLGRDRWLESFDERGSQVREAQDRWRRITSIDRALGRVLDALGERGLADDTVVVFTSLNGYLLGERGLAGKWFIFEESIRVPLIVHDPRAPAIHRGRVQGSMVLGLDLAPTLLELAGIEAPSGYEGRSLTPFLHGEELVWRTDFLYEQRLEHPEIPMSVGLRGERWVYARYDGIDPPFEQLFDLASDPAELIDLARDPAFAEVLAEQRARCDALVEE